LDTKNITVNAMKFPLISLIGGYDPAKRVVKLAPKNAVKWSKKYLQYMRASKRSYMYYPSAAKWVMHFVLWQWDDEYTTHAISLNALRKELTEFEIENAIFDLPSRFHE